jgi:hypothetical protein
MTTQKIELGAKPVCFVLMPIADVHGYEPGHFGRVYEHLLKPAIIAAGYTPLRADDTVKTDYIVVGIIQKIVESAMVLCDFSARNPNVMYELGIRHAFNKPVVLIRDKKTDKIFDIQGLRYAEYDESLRIDSVNKDISKISSSIIETASSPEKDLNSIVQLAGIKTAETPEGQTISSDTKLILSMFSNIEKRIEGIEKKSVNNLVPNFIAFKNGIVTKRGDTFITGKYLMNENELLGTLRDVDVQNQVIYVKKDKGGVVMYTNNSPETFDLTDDIPF